MKRREYFLYGNKTKITTVTSPVSQSSVSASTQGCIFFVDLRSDLNANSTPLWPGWYRGVYAFCVQGIISKMVLRWHRGDVTVPKCWIKSLFYFRKKVFSSFHNITIEPLMADGVFWRCFSYFYGPWQCNLLGSQWDSHKPLGFHPKHLKLCSEDERSFYGFGTTWG